MRPSWAARQPRYTTAQRWHAAAACTCRSTTAGRVGVLTCRLSFLGYPRQQHCTCATWWWRCVGSTTTSRSSAVTQACHHFRRKRGRAPSPPHCWRCRPPRPLFARAISESSGRHGAFARGGAQEFRDTLCPNLIGAPRTRQCVVQASRSWWKPNTTDSPGNAEKARRAFRWSVFGGAWTPSRRYRSAGYAISADP